MIQKNNVNVLHGKVKIFVFMVRPALHCQREMCVKNTQFACFMRLTNGFHRVRNLEMNLLTLNTKLGDKIDSGQIRELIVARN